MASTHLHKVTDNYHRDMTDRKYGFAVQAAMQEPLTQFYAEAPADPTLLNSNVPTQPPPNRYGMRMSDLSNHHPMDDIAMTFMDPAMRGPPPGVKILPSCVQDLPKTFNFFG